MSKKTTLLAVLLILVQTTLFAAKGDNSIKGKVIDKVSKQPIEYATAVLISLPDSIIKKSALTDKEGLFAFTGIEPGKYVVRTQFVGYAPALSDQFDSKQDVALPAMEMVSSASIREVTVAGKKPYIEKKADRTVLNVDESATASAENAYEVLRKAPNVSIDKDDNININGKQGVTVTINDRPAQLSGNDLANYLKSIQGNEIEKIEVINTPPARYEAAGNTGVINIKIKKNRKPGLNGSVYGGAKYNGDWGGNGGGSINLRKGKTNVYANVNKGRYVGSSDINITREVTVANHAMNMHQENTNDWKSNGQGFRTGIDYDINKNNTIGVLVNGYDNKSDNHTYGDMFFRGTQNAIDSSTYTNNNVDSKYSNMSYNLNYRTVLDTTGTSINVDADYAKFHTNDIANNNYTSYDSRGEVSDIPMLRSSESPSDIEIRSAKADFYHPIGSKAKLEAGLKYSDVETDNDKREKVFVVDKYENDPRRSNHFVYDEKIFAGYVSLQYEIGNTSLKGGLRVENTESKGNSITENKITKRSYIDFFPTFFVQQKLSDNHSVGLTYNRRIDRPNYGSLNPFVFYVDEYTLSEGNPYLNPQYTNNISVNYSWKSIFFTEVTYSNTDKVISSILVQTPGSAIVSEKQTNMSSLSTISWTNSLNISPCSWFRNNTNAMLLYNEYKSSNALKNSSTNVYIYSNNTFILPKKFNVEFMGMYQSPRAYGTFDIGERLSFSLGVQKTFLKDRARVKILIDDIFDTMRNHAKNNFDGIKVETRNRWSSQSISLNFSYRFGSENVKPSRERQTGLESESNRVGSGSK